MIHLQIGIIRCMGILCLVPHRIERVMVDPLSAEALMSHIRALAADIGPRPTGQPPEERARAYIRRALAEVEITSLEEQPFLTRPTIGMAFAIPLNLALAGNLLSWAGRVGT